MTQHLHLTRSPDYTGTLTYSFAPGGELTFEDGQTTVSDDVDVDRLVARYPALKVVSDPRPAEPAPDSEPASDTTDAPFDPNEHTVSALRERLDEDTEYTAAELEALRAAEADGKARETALDAIDARREG